MVAISASVHSAIASRVTAVPRKSWNVTPTIPTALHALPHDARNPSDVHGLPSLLVKMMVEHFGVASSAALSGAPTLITTRAPVLDWRSRMCVPSYADQGRRSRSPCRCPVHSASRSGRCKCAGARSKNAAGGGPDLLRAGAAAIEPTATLARVCGDEPAVQAPGQDSGENRPCIIRLPAPRTGCKPVAPRHEQPT